MSSTDPQPVGVAIIGSGNIGTDLMIKVLRGSGRLRLEALVGIDPESVGLQRAHRLGVLAVPDGVPGLLRTDAFQNVRLVFDATSAEGSRENWELLRRHGVRVIDLTPAAIGPSCVPVVNLDEHVAAPNLNMVTCGGQATVPIVAAVARVATVAYAEIVSSISSASAGPGTRANIDEFTETTAAALVSVGGAERGKAVIILNPAEPPLLMRNTVYCLVAGQVDEADVRASIEATAAAVRDYVPGYALKQQVQFEPMSATAVAGMDSFRGTKITVLIEVTGAGHHLPPFAGNLDIMTSAAVAAAERLAGLPPAAEREVSA